MNSGILYDAAITGGGVAGLSLAILLAQEGRQVIVFEREVYPFHKVCGEYISSESLPFLESLGLDLKGMNLPVITKLLLSSPAGISVSRPLDIGGTGLSRYELDLRLYKLAVSAGVIVQTGTRVKQVTCQDGQFYIKTTAGQYAARTAAGSWGKNSNIDVQLGRNYKATRERDLFIAVKHHIKTDFDAAYVEMHNFEGGYCGMSAIEDGRVNMSYIIRAANLKKHGSISAMEAKILARNPYLKRYLQHACFVFKKPLTISHLYFGVKTPITDHILMLGDAAGNIAPLSGNGMSMAMRSAKLASQWLLPYVGGQIGRHEMEAGYSAGYYEAFSKRINTARMLNNMFGKPVLTDMGMLMCKVFPLMVDKVSGMIHGEVF